MDNTKNWNCYCRGPWAYKVHGDKQETFPQHILITDCKIKGWTAAGTINKKIDQLNGKGVVFHEVY